jgi:hypothetical protein
MNLQVEKKGPANPKGKNPCNQGEGLTDKTAQQTYNRGEGYDTDNQVIDPYHLVHCRYPLALSGI